MLVRRLLDDPAVFRKGSPRLSRRDHRLSGVRRLRRTRALLHGRLAGEAFFANDSATAAQETLHWIGWFLLPATFIFTFFFFITIIVQIRAFRRGHTPLPRGCCVYTVLFGLVWAVVMRLIGNYGLTNALATGWISVGNLWMMGGLLVASRKHMNKGAIK